MQQAKALQSFDPYEMVIRAITFLLRMGSATMQERWEEASGFSPSTIATMIAGYICAAQFARTRGDIETAEYLEEYADFIESHIERWTCTTMGSLVPGITRHYMRINPVDIYNPSSNEDPNEGHSDSGESASMGETRDTPRGTLWMRDFWSSSGTAFVPPSIR